MTGTKRWLDNSNRYKTRPYNDKGQPNLVLTLFKTTDTGKDKTWTKVTDVAYNWVDNEDNTWSYTYDPLPKYENGVLLSYKVEETEPDGYEQTAYTDRNFTNRLQKNIDLTVKKQWKYGEQPLREDLVPSSITVDVYQNGALYTSGITLPMEDVWESATLTVPKYDEEGVLYEYTVTEKYNDGDGFTEVQNGKITIDGVTYGVSIADTDTSDAYNFVITNTREPEKLEPDKSVNVGNSEVKVGDILTYTITYMNNTDSTADITITDTLTDGLTFVSASDNGSVNGQKVTWTIPNVQQLAGGSVELTVRVNDKAVETVQNTASVKVGNESAVSSNPVVNKVDPVAPNEKTVDVAGKAVAVGDTLVYTIKYRNNTASAADVTITDTLTDGLTFVSATDGGVSSGQTVTWTIQNVPAYTDGQVELVVMVNENAELKIENDAEIQVGNEPKVNVEPVENVTARIQVDKEATILGSDYQKKADQTKASLNDIIRFSVVIENIGGCDLTDVTITDKMLAKAEISSVKLEPINAFESTKGKSLTDGKITYTVPELPKGQKVTVTYDYKVDEADILVDAVTNTAKVVATDPDGDEISHEDSTTTNTDDPNPHLTVSKTTTSKPAPDAEGNPKTTYALGETITYEIEVKNDGNLTITDIAVEDVLTGNTEDQAWKIDSLAPDESRVFEASYTVTEADIHTGSVVNEATATGKTKDEANPEVPVTPGKTVDKTEEPFAKLDIAKAIVNGKDSYRIGETIQYLLTVTNTGNVTVENIVLTDILTSAANAAGKVETIELEQSLAPGESVTVEYAYTVQEADLLPAYEQDGVTALKHYVQNTATVTGTDALGTACEATSNMVTAEAEHLVLVRFIDSQTGTVLKGDYIPFGGSTPPPVEREVPDYPGYTFNGWWGGIWETVYTDQNVFTNYVRREGWYPPREDNGTAIIDAEIPLAGGYISNVGDCFD